MKNEDVEELTELIHKNRSNNDFARRWQFEIVPKLFSKYGRDTILFGNDYWKIDRMFYDYEDRKKRYKVFKMLLSLFERVGNKIKKGTKNSYLQKDILWIKEFARQDVLDMFSKDQQELIKKEYNKLKYFIGVDVK